jgi:PAS domain S-box-containing protein
MQVFVTHTIHSAGEKMMPEKPSYEVLEQKIEELQDCVQLLKKNELLFSKSQEIGKLGHFSYDLASGIVEGSSELFRIFDVDPEAPSLESFSNAVHPDDGHLIFPFIDRAVQEELPYDVEHRVLHRNSDVLHVHARGEIVKTSEGRKMFGVVQDITERRPAEEKQKKLEAQLSNAMEIAHLGHWEYDVEKDLFTFNDQFYKIFRTTADQAGGYFMTSEQYAEGFVHPEDCEMVGNEIRKCIETTDSNFNRQLEHRILYADGETGYVTIRYYIVKDSQGKTVKTYGVIQDITVRKQMEQERLANLKFFENMDKVNRAIQQNSDLEQMMSDVLDIVLSVFECDRAWLVYPCDLEAATWIVPMERTKPEYPGALALGLEVPMDPEVIRVYKAVLSSPGPVGFGPGNELVLPSDVAKRFKGQSQLAMAVYPKVDKPYMFGIHQCSQPRVWSQEDRRLLKEIGRRLEDALTTFLMYRNLRDSEERLRKIIENTGAGYFSIDLDGIFKNINMSWLRMHGYASADEIIGRHFSVTQVETDLNQAQAIVESLLSGKTITADEFSRNCKNGSVGYHSFSANPVVKEGKIVGLEGFIIDVTDRKRAEEALRNSEKKYRTMMESFVDPLYICSGDFTVEYMNPAMIHRIGRDATGEKCYYALHGLDSKCEECIFEKVASGEILESDVHSPLDGKNYRVTNMPIHNPDGTLSKMTIFRDITDYLHAVKEKEKAQEQLLRSQKLESIGNLAGGIAHDFNNILSSIIGFTELALDDSPKGTVAEDCLQEVFSAGKRAKALVRQILAFARQSDEKRSPIQPGTVAKEVLKFIRSTIPTTIEIRQDLSSDSWIMGNAIQIHQVLMNLCTNAAHAMEDSGGILSVSLNDVVIDKRDLLIGMRQGHYIEIKVSDTGIGIAPEMIESIFEPYFTTKGPGEGTGMGLAMAQGIIESYGGKLTVDSLRGKGTTFSIYLPVTKKRSTHGDYVPEEVPAGTERILLVDDELSIAKMSSQMLERLGYSVTTRTSSVEALELFQAKPEAFDLVLTDMTMPNLTGDKLAVELMKIRHDIPIILCTGYSKKISDETAAEIGIKAFAYKPMVKADLAKTVRKVLEEAGTKS